MEKNILVFLCTLLLSMILIGCNNNEIKQNNQNIDTENSTNNIEENSSKGENIQKDESKLNYEKDIVNQNSLTALVNKNYRLDAKYNPEDLVKLQVRTVLNNAEINQLREEAALALKEMFESAEKDGIYLYARSGYRSYKTQEQLFNSYALSKGEEVANRYSANAGESEHQTGLAIDITSKSVNLQLSDYFGETKEGKWVQENAHKFGFIIRYPLGKEEITGYIYEPWHMRYLGNEIATDVYESGLTYEEFLLKEGIKLESKY